jgi:hypothetical protein
LLGEHLCVETLYKMTNREIVAGRMNPDDKIRGIAVNGIAADSDI